MRGDRSAPAFATAMDPTVSENEMPAKVFEIDAYRSGFRAPNGVVFPELYRVEGCYFEPAEDGSVMPTNRAAPIDYSLSIHTDPGLANPKWSPIRRLEPLKDVGWVIVRHHMQRAFVEGYFDALSDKTVLEAVSLYATKEGLFTVLRMMPPPGAPDHLLIYVTKVQLHDGPFAGEWIDMWQIVHPDGSITDDFDVLMSVG